MELELALLEVLYFLGGAEARRVRACEGAFLKSSGVHCWRGGAAGATLEVFDATCRRISTATAGAEGAAPLVLPVELAAGVYVVKCGSQVQRLTVE